MKNRFSNKWRDLPDIQMTLSFHFPSTETISSELKNTVLGRECFREGIGLGLAAKNYATTESQLIHIKFKHLFATFVTDQPKLR